MPMTALATSHVNLIPPIERAPTPAFHSPERVSRAKTSMARTSPAPVIWLTAANPTSGFMPIMYLRTESA